MPQASGSREVSPDLHPRPVQDDGKHSFTTGVPCSLARAWGGWGFGGRDLQQIWLLWTPGSRKGGAEPLEKGAMTGGQAAGVFLRRRPGADAFLTCLQLHVWVGHCRCSRLQGDFRLGRTGSKVYVLEFFSGILGLGLLAHVSQAYMLIHM